VLDGLGEDVLPVKTDTSTLITKQKRVTLKTTLTQVFIK